MSYTECGRWTYEALPLVGQNRKQARLVVRLEDGPDTIGTPGKVVITESEPGLHTSECEWRPFEKAASTFLQGLTV